MKLTRKHGRGCRKLTYEDPDKVIGPEFFYTPSLEHGYTSPVILSGVGLRIEEQRLGTVANVEIGDCRVRHQLEWLTMGDDDRFSLDLLDALL